MDQQLLGGSIPQDFNEFQVWLQSLFSLDATGNIIENPQALQYVGGNTNPEDTTIRESHYSFNNIREAFYLQQYCIEPSTPTNPTPSESIIHALVDNFLLSAFIAWTTPIELRAQRSQYFNYIFQRNTATSLSFGQTNFCKAPENEIFLNVKLNKEILNLQQQLAYQKNELDSQAQLLTTAAEEQAVLRSSIDAIKQEQNLATENLAKQFQQQYQDLQTSTDAIVKEKNVTLLQEIEQLRSILGTIQEDHQREMKKIIETNESLLKDANEKLETKEKLKNQEIEYMKEKCKSEVQEMRHQCTNQLQEMKQKCEKDKEENTKLLKDEFQVQYDDVILKNKTLEEKYKKYQQDIKVILKKVNEFEVQNQSLKEGLVLRDQKIETQEQIYNQQISTQKALYEDKINQYLANTTSLNQQVNLLTLQLTQKTADFQTDKERIRNEEKIQCTNELTRLQETSDRRFFETSNYLKLKTEHDIAEINRNHKLELEILKKELSQNNNNNNGCIIM